MLQMKKEIVNIWEYKVDNNANIANFVSLWKTRLSRSAVWNTDFKSKKSTFGSILAC